MGIVKSRESDLLELHVVASPEGEASSTTVVGWKLTDELFAQMEEKRFEDPHLLLVVASLDDDYCTATKVYSIRLGTAKVPKQHVQFSRAGTNLVIATIVDVRNAEQRSNIRHLTHSSGNLYLNPKGQIHWDNYLQGLPNLKLQATQKVYVDSSNFAPPPPRWLKNIVRVFFRGKEDDQCHFRKRAIVSILGMIPLQLYGIFARPLTLLFALVCGLRGMTLRSFFALRPHDFARNLDDSFWFKDNKGDDRPMSSPLVWLNPVTISIIVIVVSVLALPGYLFLSIFSPLPEGMPFFEQYVRSLVVAVPVDLAIALAIFLIWFTFSRNGQRTRRSWLATVSMLFQPKPPALQVIQQQQPQQLAGNDDVLRLPNSSFALLFNETKSRVCKPFQH